MSVSQCVNQRHTSTYNMAAAVAPTVLQSRTVGVTALCCLLLLACSSCAVFGVDAAAAAAAATAQDGSSGSATAAAVEVGSASLAGTTGVRGGAGSVGMAATDNSTARTPTAAGSSRRANPGRVKQLSFLLRENKRLQAEIEALEQTIAEDSAAAIEAKRRLVEAETEQV